MTVFAQPFQQLVVVDDPERGRVVTEGAFILPADNQGMRAILRHLGASGPVVYFYKGDGGSPRRCMEAVPPPIEEQVRSFIRDCTDLPPLTLSGLRAPLMRRIFGYEVPDFSRHLHGDGYTVRVAEGPIQLATGVGHEDFGRFKFWGAGRTSGVLITGSAGEWVGILLPMGRPEDQAPL